MTPPDITITLPFLQSLDETDVPDGFVQKAMLSGLSIRGNFRKYSILLFCVFGNTHNEKFRRRSTRNNRCDSSRVSRGLYVRWMIRLIVLYTRQKGARFGSAFDTPSSKYRR